jgi:hypothetical protein
MIKFRQFGWIVGLLLGLQASCFSQGDQQLRLSLDKFGELTVKEEQPGEYEILTTGNDPYIVTEALQQTIPAESYILSFDYFCPSWLDHLQIYFGSPIDEKRSIHTELGVAEGWTTFSIEVKNTRDYWGKKGDVLRLDFGSAPNYRMKIKNIRFRKPTDREVAIAAKREENRVIDERFASNINRYLDENYSASVTDVSVTKDKIVVKGNTGALKGSLFLAEIPLYQKVTERNSFDRTIQLAADKKSFTITTNRYVSANGITYDRMFSKWAITQKTGEAYALQSHARYADQITPMYDLPDEKPWGKKGLGGFHAGKEMADLDSLDISSITVNIWITKFIKFSPSAGTMPFTYNGKTYYVDRKAVEQLDKTILVAAERKIITSAIILIDKASGTADKKIGEIFEHPDCDPAGIYSMANVTSAEGLEYYAAIMDFFAARYSRPDKKYGRIHHWIMHNEVDAGWVWTNMGEKPPLVFMDDYVKSMRTVYNIARSYNAHSKVFISLTHYWNWTADRHYYHPKELLDILLRYSKAEGDFEWAIAQHPYPESLFEPKTWLDGKVDFTFDTPLITYKNIEVLDAWVKQPRALYKGKIQRTIHLSEQGFNSLDYSEKSLQEQAAGMAYAWKKIKNLESIEANQYHNWFDNRGEGGLRIGLRRFPDDADLPGGKKPIWNVFRDMGTSREEATFAPFLKLIGVKDWAQILYQGEIEPNRLKNSYRDLESDTWEATDALGRSLPGFKEVGPAKKDRYVGMFYFLTANSPGREGLFDVTKIKAADPKNPKWGNGAHYWGEPELGYYISSDEWVIRQHATLLADAGVDVLIFDCTNNVTYPNVTTTIFNVFRKMRQEGEKTPSIAFLASEASVYQIWDQIYSKGLYADLWFHWKGKPLLLFGQWVGIKPMNDVKFSSKITNFFSLRHSWAWTTLPWYKDEGKDMWPWVDHSPQSIGWHEDKSKAEYVPVAVGEHPLSNIGRSFHDGKQPEIDEFDLTPITGNGVYFQEQWDRAIEVDPEFVFVTGWNEWTAGNQVMSKDIEKSLKTWDFFPGAKLGMVGREIKPGETYFIDQYNQEYSRDIEPMKGGHTDNYYYQLMANIRRYKGVRKPSVGKEKTINLNGNFSQWDDVATTYHDHIGDTEHRDVPGNYTAGPYINRSGRNDIVRLKVTHDKQYVYFYAETAKSLTSYTDKNWMQLFIDTDRKKQTGWEGYDLVINHKLVDSKTTTVGWLDSTGSVGKNINVPIKIGDNKLMVRLPKALVEQNGKLKFNFHCADNITAIGDIQEFFTQGDSAPSRRANYVYEGE